MPDPPYQARWLEPLDRWRAISRWFDEHRPQRADHTSAPGNRRVHAASQACSTPPKRALASSHASPEALAQFHERACAEHLGDEQVSDSAAIQCQGLVAFEMGPIPIPGLLPVQAFGWQSYGAAPPHHHHHHHPSHWMLVKLVCLLCPLISSDTHTIERCLFSGASCPHCFVLLQPLSVWHEQR